MERNKEREKREGTPAPNSAIQLPFIIVNTSKKTVIDCSISNDKMEYLFNFDNTFEIHDDMEVSIVKLFSREIDFESPIFCDVTFTLEHPDSSTRVQS